MSKKTQMAALGAWAAAMVAVAPLNAAPIRVLIISGQTVHDVKSTTPFLERMYNEDAKRFRVVRIVEDVARITPETFAECDVIVSNWTCHPIMTGGPWTAEGKKAFADAISGGKGMVSFHAASAACNDWAEFQQISGLSWKWNHTSHTAYHTFKVSIEDGKHPITKGLSDFWITDELYQRMVKMTDSEFRTLASAFAEQGFGGTQKTEPMLITTQLGKGRGVNFLLGHDVAAMRNPAWQTIMLRATEWAATGRATVPVPADWPGTPAAAALVGVDPDAAIAAATQYAHGSARGPLFVVEQLVNDATSRTDKNAAAQRANLAARLGAAVAACKTSEAKAFFCKQLGKIGTADQIPAIVPLLADEQAAMMARFALERIEGPAAGAALREALPKLEANLKIGAINSIGERADADAVPALSPLLGDSDTATAAAAALGKIGTATAATALTAARQEASEPLRASITDACLTCGGKLIASGDKSQAASIGKLLYAPAEPPFVRAAGLRLAALAQPSKATPLLQEALESSVHELHVAVAQLLRDQPRIGDTRTLAAAAMRAPADVLPVMIAALVDRGDQAALPSIRRGYDHENEAVRLATFAALGRLGEQDDAALLADRAARGGAAERAAALEALRTMPGQAALEAIANLLTHQDAAVRKAAVAALANRPADALILERLAKTEDAALQADLLAALPQIATEPALEIARQYATRENPALRQAALDALMRWPTAAPLDTLLQALRERRDAAERPALVQAVLRMIPTAPAADGRKAAFAGEVLQAADRPEDKRAALKLLGGYAVPESLAVALDAMKQPELFDDAAAALLQVSPRLVDTHKAQVQAAMRELIATARTGEWIHRADTVLRKADRPANLARGAVADSPDGIDSDGAASGDGAAIDGDPATYWDEVDNQKLYCLRLTFPKPTRISAILIKGHAFESHSPKDFDIVCDGNVVKTVRGATYDRPDLETLFSFEPTTCGSLELRITGYYGGSPAIRELEVYDWPQAAAATRPEASAAAAAAATEPVSYAWKQTDASLALMNGERIVWRLNYGKDLPKVYFDPVNLPDGTELVWLCPPDHEWHFALWFSWKELNGLNYWEQWNVAGQGRTELLQAQATAHADFSADFAMTVSYHPDGKPTLLTEQRTIRVHPPDASGAYRIDWTSTFQAGAEDVHMKGGTAGGGYAGLSVRISARTREWQLCDSEGRRDASGPGMAKNTHGHKARWADFSLVGMLTDRPAGIAIFDHPANLRHPSAWHNLIDDAVPFGYFSPAPLWSEPYTLAAGKDLTLRYRIVVHPGRSDVAQLDREFQAFAGQ